MRNEREEILDPECDTERWWALAVGHPLEAMSSALFPLLTLEDPARREKMQKKYITTWISSTAERLPFRGKHLFAADCAEHVLYLYERDHPNDSRVRDAIAAYRCFANGMISQEDWTLVKESVNAIGDLMTTDWSSASAWSLAWAADSEICAAMWTAESVRRSVYPPNRFSVFYAELLWQWEQLQKYLRGEIQ